MQFQSGSVPRNYKDMTGARVGKLLVISRAGTSKGGMAMWQCLCDCGKELVIQGGNLRHRQRSCGCDRKTTATHGLSGSTEFRSWGQMIQRCTNERLKTHKHYGGRGIRVCDRWMESFENFYADMGAKPSPKHSLDRIDVDGNYEPGNCRWATPQEQSRNRRTSVYVGDVFLLDAAYSKGLKPKTAYYRAKHDVSLDKPLGRQIELVAAGLKMSMVEWSRLTGIPRSTISVRHKKGWSHERILELEVN